MATHSRRLGIVILLVAASYGLQAGVQDFEYAMFFMTDSAMAGQSDVYAFVFGEQGLMAGMGVQGSKITRMKP